MNTQLTIEDRLIMRGHLEELIADLAKTIPVDLDHYESIMMDIDEHKTALWELDHPYHMD